MAHPDPEDHLWYHQVEQEAHCLRQNWEKRRAEEEEDIDVPWHYEEKDKNKNIRKGWYVSSEAQGATEIYPEAYVAAEVVAEGLENAAGGFEDDGDTRKTCLDEESKKMVAKQMSSAGLSMISCPTEVLRGSVWAVWSWNYNWSGMSNNMSRAAMTLPLKRGSLQQSRQWENMNFVNYFNKIKYCFWH